MDIPKHIAEILVKGFERIEKDVASIVISNERSAKIGVTTSMLIKPESKLVEKMVGDHSFHEQYTKPMLQFVFDSCTDSNARLSGNGWRIELVQLERITNNLEELRENLAKSVIEKAIEVGGEQANMTYSEARTKLADILKPVVEAVNNLQPEQQQAGGMGGPG